MKKLRSDGPESSAWILGICVVVAGGAACASGGAPLSQMLTLLVAALAAGLGGLMVSGCRAQGSAAARDSAIDHLPPDGGDGEPDSGAADAPPDASGPFQCGSGSLPPGAPGTTGWSRCCLGGQIRACPPPPPTTACNYGWNETYCPDGITCGLTWMDPCGTGIPDAGSPDAMPDATADTGVVADAATDAPPAPDGAADLATDMFLRCGEGSRSADGGMPGAGWLRCCVDNQIHWCPPQPPNIVCNYGMGQTFCPDGVTCGWQTMNPCGTDDGGAAEVGP